MTNHATSFLSITSHWLDDDFNHYIAVLRAIPLPGQHTGQHLNDELSTALDNSDIPILIQTHLMSKRKKQITFVSYPCLTVFIVLLG